MAATPGGEVIARMIQTAAWLPPEPDGAWKEPAANGIATRNSRLLTVQLAVVAMTPALTAAAAPYPCRWKNLTPSGSLVTSAASLPGPTGRRRARRAPVPRRAAIKVR